MFGKSFIHKKWDHVFCHGYWECSLKACSPWAPRAGVWEVWAQPTENEKAKNELWVRIHIWHTAHEAMLFGHLSPLLGQRWKRFNTLRQHWALRVRCVLLRVSPTWHLQRWAGGEVLQTGISVLRWCIDSPCSRGIKPRRPRPFLRLRRGKLLEAVNAAAKRRKKSQC